jgi:hypothetical protein
MRKGLQSCALLAAVATVAGGWVGYGPSPSGAPTPVTATQVDLPFVSEARVQCGLCDDCYKDGEGWGHLAREDPAGQRELPTGSHPCQTPDRCDSQEAGHPFNFEQCPGYDPGELVDPDGLVVAPLPELWFAFRRAHGDDLVDLLEAQGSRVEYNPGRRAVQFLGCNEAVVAHLPLTDEQVTFLE